MRGRAIERWSSTRTIRRSPAVPSTKRAEPMPELPQVIVDDSDHARPGDRSLLIIENDPSFARVLVDEARENGFKALVAMKGASALVIAREYLPTAITLDINMPDLDGWKILDRLKDGTATRHVPVHIISTEEARERGLRMGAIGVLAKPVKTKETLDGVFAEIRKFLDKSHRTLLVVEADDQRRAGLVELLRDDGVDALSVGTAADALALVSAQPIDLIVMEFSQPGSKGLDLIDEIKEATGARDLPVIVFTERALSKKEEMQLKRMTQTAVVKDVRSRERLLDEVAMFL